MSLTPLLDIARTRRSALAEQLGGEDTDTWRLFHGAAEGRAGLTVDQYGGHVLVQTFRELLGDGELDEIQRAVGLECVWRHRGPGDGADYQPPAWALEHRPFRELGIGYEAPLVHQGQDPWLFLDLRAARRWIGANAGGLDVLNAFAYTGGAGLVAALGGAASVTQLDHGGWCLEAEGALAKHNGLRTEQLRVDFIVALRQFAGLGVRGRAARRGYRRLDRRRFGLIVLDPPTFTRGPFGAVDIVRDYASLAKPCLLSLKPGGILLATNHSAAVEMDAWVDSVRRCGHKAGVSIRHFEAIEPDGDYPSFDGFPPLKVGVFRT